jgi:single-strand DNA-binding protein
MPDPSHKRPPTNPAPEPSMLAGLDRMADFVGSTACPWRSLGMPRHPPVLRSTRTGQTARPGIRKGHTMTEAAVSFAGNLTDDPHVRYTESGIARTMFRVAVSSRVRDGEPSFFTVMVWRDQAEQAPASLAKGCRVVVIGRLQQRAWTADDGSARSAVEVVAEELGPSLR